MKDRTTTPKAGKIDAAIALANAAVAWWEDHDREDCHFCGAVDPRPFPRAVHEGHNHDEGCPVGIYVDALIAEKAEIASIIGDPADELTAEAQRLGMYDRRTMRHSLDIADEEDDDGGEEEA